jgi:group I intron endonuclease
MTSRWAHGKIYILTNKVDNETYIGSTTLTLHERWREHVRTTRKLPERCLYKHINEVGVDNVSIHLIEEYPCNSKIELELRENVWIRELNPTLNVSMPANNSLFYRRVPELTQEDKERVHNLLSKSSNRGNSDMTLNNLKNAHDQLQRKYDCLLQAYNHKYKYVDEVISNLEQENKRLWKCVYKFSEKNT